MYNQRFTSTLSHYRRQMISIESATTPQNFNSLSCAGANLGVLAFKISVLRQKLVIIFTTCAGAKLGVLGFKISVLRQKLVIICAIRAGANLVVLKFIIRNKSFTSKIVGR